MFEIPNGSQASVIISRFRLQNPWILKKIMGFGVIGKFRPHNPQISMKAPDFDGFYIESSHFT